MIPMFLLHSRFTTPRLPISINRNVILKQLIGKHDKSHSFRAIAPYNMSDTKDFSTSPTTAAPAHVNFDLETGKRPSISSANHRPTSIRSDSDGIPPSPMLRRRQTRANTGLTFRTVDATPLRPSWHPGQEPGLDPSKPNGGRPHTPDLHEECQITVVDFSEDNIDVHDFDNDGLIAFISKPQESWIKCRWISVNGLSWDVIQALGQHKKLHRLALEDLTNPNNRTKADW
jgi:hypothetical protein